MSKSSLLDFFARSQYQMADISRKKETRRVAVAMGRISVGAGAFAHVKNGTLPKGDVLKLAEIAGVGGAKLAWQHIPMCHPLLLDHVAIAPELEEKTYSVAVYASVSTTAKTGVEMEALAAVNAALLTLYDLTKPVEPALEIKDIRLLYKKGGKKGVWVHPEGLPEELQGFVKEESSQNLKGKKAAILTMSDRASKGEYEDKSGAILKEALEGFGCEIVETEILSDDASALEEKISELSQKVDLILTTGGTGLGPRDITPQTLKKLATYEVPGIGELLREDGASHIKTAWLSRSIAAVIGNSLVIALPGSTGGVRDGLSSLAPILSHALDLIKGAGQHQCDNMGDENT